MVTEAALAALGDVDATGIPVSMVPQAVMNTVTGFNIHRGCLAIGKRGTPLDWRGLSGTARRLVVLERVANTDNVGAIFRNASAFGVDAVLLGPDCAIPLTGKPSARRWPQRSPCRSPTSIAGRMRSGCCASRDFT